MMLRYGFCAFVVAATVAGISGCSSNNSTLGSTGGPCGAPSGSVALAYPAPGSTGIPDNFPGVIFASTKGLTSSYQAIVVPAGASVGTTLLTVAAAPSPLPSPYVAPYANGIYDESAVPSGFILPAATQISVYLNDSGSNCTPSLQGTFTSQ